MKQNLAKNKAPMRFGPMNIFRFKTIEKICSKLKAIKTGFYKLTIYLPIYWKYFSNLRIATKGQETLNKKILK